MSGIGRNVVEASRLEWSQAFAKKIGSHHMNKALRTLTATIALASVAGCGSPDATGETPAGSTGDLSDSADGSAVPQGNDPGPAAAPENEAVAPSPAPQADESEAAGSDAAFDAMNSRFSLDGQTVVLKDGLSQVPAAPGSASSLTTRYLGKAARGDLTGDGKEDVAYLVTREGGGSGRFTYVVAAIAGADGYKTTNAFPVGDRIEPQSLRINARELQVNFLGRGRGEPMTAPPSRASALLLKVTPGGVLEGLMK